jgi:hypothetical protein
MSTRDSDVKQDTYRLLTDDKGDKYLPEAIGSNQARYRNSPWGPLIIIHNALVLQLSHYEHNKCKWLSLQNVSVFFLPNYQEWLSLQAARTWKKWIVSHYNYQEAWSGLPMEISSVTYVGPRGIPKLISF